MRAWMRYGIALSVIWILIGGSLGNNWAIRQASTRTSAEVDECLAAYRARPRANDGGIWTPCWDHFGENYQRNVDGHWWAAARLALIPLPFAWLIIYFFVRLYYLVKRRA